MGAETLINLNLRLLIVRSGIRWVHLERFSERWRKIFLKSLQLHHLSKNNFLIFADDAK